MKNKATLKRIVLLVMFLVSCGITLIPLYYTLLDWRTLDRINAQVMKNHQTLSDRELNFLLSRELTHRINTAFDATWTFQMLAINVYLFVKVLEAYTDKPDKE